MAPDEGWPSRDPIGERGGINLYGMVGNDVLNRWDILGLWTPVQRNGGAWATTCAEPGDTWQELANELRLERRQRFRWVENTSILEGDPVPGKTYKVPNTTVVWMSDAQVMSGDWVFGWAYFVTKLELKEVVEARKSQGFKVVEEWNGDSKSDFADKWKTEGIYDIYFGGHGIRARKGGRYFAFNSEPSNDRNSSRPRDVETSYRLAVVVAAHCGGWTMGWDDFVSMNGGLFMGYDGAMTAFNKSEVLKTKRNELRDK